MKSTKDREQKRRSWEKHVDRASRFSGGKSAYCRQHGLRESHLWYWQKRVKRQAGNNAAKSFVPIQVTSHSESQRICIRIGDVSMELNDQVDPRWVAKAVYGIRETSS